MEGNFRRALNRAPSLAERMRAGRREERFYGNADLPNVFRKPYGPGWALVGDAGLHRDPITVQGIVDAFRDAELLSDALAGCFMSGVPEDTALADYEQRRNAAAMSIYEVTYGLASLEPPSPEMQALFSAVYGNQLETNRFLGLVEGTTSIPEYFAYPKHRSNHRSRVAVG